MALPFQLDPEEGLQAWTMTDPFSTRTTAPARSLAEIRKNHSDADVIRKRSAYRQRVCILSAQFRLRIYKQFVTCKKAMEESTGEKIDVSTVEGLSHICQQLLWEIVERSKRNKRDSNGNIVTRYMGTQTLSIYRWGIQLIMDREWKTSSSSSRSNRDFNAFWERIHTYVAELVDEFSLSNVRKHKLALYSQDVAVMVMQVLDSPADSDVAIHFAVYLLMILHTAARPSTLLTGKGNNFAYRWSDLTFVPRRNSSKVVLGFDVIIRYRNFKGYGFNASVDIAKNLTLYIRTIRSSDNIVFDLGSMLIAHGLRQGVFGTDTTVADLFCLDKAKFQAEPKILEHPVFYASSSRGFGLDRTTPWKGEAAGIKFREVARQCGFYKSTATEDEIIGASSIRRGTATRLVQAFGLTTARLILAHNPGSTVLEKNYDLSIEQTDLVSGVMGEEEEEAISVNVRPKMYEIRCPRLRLLTHGLGVLTECALQGSDLWMQHDLYKQIAGISSSQVWEMLTKTKRVIKQRVRSIHGLQGRQASANEAARRASLNVEDTIQNPTDYNLALKSLSDKALQSFCADCADDLVNLPPLNDTAAAEPEFLYVDSSISNGDISDNQDPETAEGSAEKDVAAPAAGAGNKPDGEDNEEAVPSLDKGIRPVLERVTSAFEATRDLKFKWLTYLSDLKGTSEEQRTTQSCRRCLEEPHTSYELLQIEYNPSQLRKHLQRTHTPYHETSTWLR
ncbi:uncharacterized protein IL334_005410 [Kwoniella shivajii]|uniref:Ndc10 domain-containing protein n=1 Tax=Kwoniella shivajii TaxID=564305 RepID=A0ABZ1D545_9TREE|nr:hypothetical protein IL334_005410 [Kwoniella shivajii]